MEREIGTANGNDELRSSRSVLRGCLPSVLRGCLPRDRLAAREGVPRNKISEKKKDDGLGILHNGWRSPNFSLAIFIWGFAICLKFITSNA
jgi:hypothetical protein